MFWTPPDRPLACILSVYSRPSVQLQYPFQYKRRPFGSTTLKGPKGIQSDQNAIVLTRSVQIVSDDVADDHIRWSSTNTCEQYCGPAVRSGVMHKGCNPFKGTRRDYIDAGRQGTDALSASNIRSEGSQDLMYLRVLPDPYGPGCGARGWPWGWTW